VIEGVVLLRPFGDQATDCTALATCARDTLNPGSTYDEDDIDIPPFMRKRGR
jgi:hypothetical protein